MKYPVNASISSHTMNEEPVSSSCESMLLGLSLGHIVYGVETIFYALDGVLDSVLDRAMIKHFYFLL